MSLLFNMLSRFVIAFLSRSKCLLISWLQSLFAVILEPKKIKSVTASTFSPSICREVMGPDVMILIFLMLSQFFSLSSFTIIKRLFSSSSLSAIRLVSSAYLRLSSVRLDKNKELGNLGSSPRKGASWSRQSPKSSDPVDSGSLLVCKTLAQHKEEKKILSVCRVLRTPWRLKHWYLKVWSASYKCKVSDPTLVLLIQKLHSDKILWQLPCTLKYEKQWSKVYTNVNSSKMKELIF